MSLSSINFSHLINKLPAEAAALTCLEDLFKRSMGTDKEFTPRRLYDLCTPRSMKSLSTILEELTNSGVLKKEIRVISPFTGGCIGKYESLIDIPTEIHDYHEDRLIEVTTKDIEIVYKVESIS